MIMDGFLRIIAVTFTLFLCLLTIYLNFCTAESVVRCIEKVTVHYSFRPLHQIVIKVVKKIVPLDLLSTLLSF